MMKKSTIFKMVNNPEWYRFLCEIENLQMFSLCNDFDKLSLDDKIGGSSSTSTSNTTSSTGIVKRSSYTNRDVYNRIVENCRLTVINRAIMEKTHAPFIDIPLSLLNSISYPAEAYDIKMGLGFRFLPGQSEFMLQELKLPESFERLSFIKDSLGLSYHSAPLNGEILFSYCRSGVGLRGLVNEGSPYQKVLIEVITYYSGRYGRFLILVGIGLGCTVWYGYAPGTHLHVHDTSFFAPFESYDPFLDMEYYRPGFQKVSILEKSDIVSASVETAFKNEQPFADISVPASGPVLKAVCLGVMIAFFLAVGLVPNDCGEIAAQFNTMLGVGITTRSFNTSTHTNDLSTSKRKKTKVDLWASEQLSKEISFFYYNQKNSKNIYNLDEDTVHRIREQVEKGFYSLSPLSIRLCHQEECNMIYTFKSIEPSGYQILIEPTESDKLFFDALSRLINNLFLDNDIHGIRMTANEFYSKLNERDDIKCFYRVDLARSLSTIDKSDFIIMLKSVIGKNILYYYIEELLNVKYVHCSDNTEAYLSGISIPPVGRLTCVLHSLVLHVLDEEITSLYPSINYSRYITEVYIANYGDLTEDNIYSLLDELNIAGKIRSIGPGMESPCSVGVIGIDHSGKIYVNYNDNNDEE